MPAQVIGGDVAEIRVADFGRSVGGRAGEGAEAAEVAQAGRPGHAAGGDVAHEEEEEGGEGEEDGGVLERSAGGEEVGEGGGAVGQCFPPGSVLFEKRGLLVGGDQEEGLESPTRMREGCAEVVRCRGAEECDGGVVHRLEDV